MPVGLSLSAFQYQIVWGITVGVLGRKEHWSLQPTAGLKKALPEILTKVPADLVVNGASAYPHRRS